MAARHASELEITHWGCWSNVKTAKIYIEEGLVKSGKIGQFFSNRVRFSCFSFDFLSCFFRPG